MSEVRARAEERRKKILARQNKQVSAIGDEINITSAIGDAETTIEDKEKELKTPERPLASRRQYVRSLSEKAVTVKDSQEEDNKEIESVPQGKESEEDPGVESIEEVLSMKRSQSSTISLNSESTKNTPKKEFVYSNKTVKEIEAEVALNTKKYDESVMKKDSAPSTEKKMRPKVEIKSNIQPSSIMRLIRLLLIVAVGVVLGYQTVMVQHRVTLSSSSHSAVSSDHLQVLSAVESVEDEFAFPSDSSASSSEVPIVIDQSSSAGRTWLGWFLWKLRSQVECTLSAVALVWWASRNLSPIVTLRFKNAPAANGGSYLNMALNLWQTGFEGLFEHAYSLLGELSLYVAVLVAAVVGFTVLYSGTVGEALLEDIVAAVVTNGAEGIASEL